MSVPQMMSHLGGRCLRDAKHLLWAQDAGLPSMSQLTSLAASPQATLELDTMDVRLIIRSAA